MRARAPRDWWGANDMHIGSSAADGLNVQDSGKGTVWTRRERHHIYDGRIARRCRRWLIHLVDIHH
jgi:hypothetical protein